MTVNIREVHFSLFLLPSAILAAQSRKLLFYIFTGRFSTVIFARLCLSLPP